MPKTTLTWNTATTTSLFEDCVGNVDAFSLTLVGGKCVSNDSRNLLPDVLCVEKDASYRVRVALTATVAPTQVELDAVIAAVFFIEDADTGLGNIIAEEELDYTTDALGWTTDFEVDLQAAMKYSISFVFYVNDEVRFIGLSEKLPRLNWSITKVTP